MSQECALTYVADAHITGATINEEAEVTTMTLNEQLREAIQDSGETLYAIAKATGVHYGVIHRFVIGQRDMYLQTASKLVDHLGLKLTQVKKPRK
jgi:hypothetical protein